MCHGFPSTSEQFSQSVSKSKLIMKKTIQRTLSGPFFPLAISARRSHALGTDSRNCKRSTARMASALGLLAGGLMLLTPAISRAADAEMIQNTSAARLWTENIWTPTGTPNGIDSAIDFGNRNWGANKTITVTAGITVGTLRFGDWGGAQQIFLVSANAVTFAVSSGTPLVQAYNNTARLDFPIAGSQGITAEGFITAGTVEMRAINTYTGPTTVDGGAYLWFRNGVDGRRIDPASVLTFAGGSLQGDSAGYVHEAASTTIAAGSSTILNVLRMNAINRQTGGVVNFFNAGADTDTSDVNGILGGYATFAGTDWAHSGAAAADTAISAYTGYTDLDALGSTIADDATLNVRFNSAAGSGNIALTATTTTANTLLHNTAAAATIDTAGKTLRLGPTGGILVNANGAALTIGAAVNDGTLTAGGADNTAGDVIIINNNAAVATVNAVVANNGSGVVAFTKAGSGPVTLATANTYGGDTTVGAGTLKLGSATAIPTGSSAGNVKVNGTLDLNGNSVQVNGLSGYGAVNSAAAGTITLTVGDNNATSTFRGVISNGGATVSLTKIGSGTLVLAGNNTYTGVTTVNGGALSLGDGLRILWGADPAPIGTASSSIVLNNGANLILNKRERTLPTLTSVISGNGSVTKAGIGALRVNSANTYDGDTTISAGIWKVGNVNSIPSGVGKGNVTHNGYLDLNGNSITFNGFSGGGSVTDSAGAGTSILTVGGNDVSSTFSGAISNGIPTATRLIGLTKTGSGTLTLTGVCRYNAATTVSVGTLLVNGSLVSPTVATAASAVTVASGATLGGTGTIGGVTTVSAGATLAPGTSIGTLTFTNSLALSGTTSMEVNKTAVTADKIVMSSGTVTLGGNLTVVNLAGTLAKDDTFDLIDGTIAGAFSSYTLPSLATGLAWDTSQLSVGGNGTLKVVCDGTLTASSGSDVSTCSGVGVGIGGGPTASGGSGSGYTYLWSPATGLNDATLANPTASPITTTAYTVTVTDSEGCTAVSSAVTVTVNLPTITLGANPHVCPGTTSANLTYSATTCSPNEYSIDFDAAAEAQGFSDVALTGLPASPITITVPGAAPSATYNATLTVKNSTSGDVSAGVAITVTVDAPPVISASPTNLTVGANSPASFYVTATGAGLTYQWQVSGDGGTTFTNVTGNGTAASYTNLSAALSDNGLQYQVIVSGTCNPSTTSTPPALLTVIFSPKAVVSGDATICLGGSTLISAALTGTAPWDVYWSDGVTQTGVASSPATRNVSPGVSTVYTVTNLVDQNFTAFLSDLTGSASVAVNYSPAITVQPTNIAVCASSPVVFDVAATGASLTYQWQVSGDGGTTFTNISATATNASYTNLVTALSDNGYQYQVIVSGACNPAVTSAPPAVLTINATPTLSVSKTDATCNGTPNGTVVATYGGGTPGYTISLDGGAFAPATGSPQTFTGLGLGTHTVQVLDANGCSSGVQTTDPIGQPTAVTANAGVDVTACASTSVQIGGSPTGSGGTGALTYLWNPATGLNDATLANPTASDASTITYTVTVTDANGCTGNDSVLVNRAPVDPLSWVAGSASWDFSAIADRWQDATPRAAVYCNGRAVALGEGATEASPVITLDTTVLPTSVTANATTKAYTISGTGKISGSTGVTKSGSGTLTLNTTNDYSGNTTVSAGVLRIANATALGNVTGTTTNTAGAIEISGGITVAGEGFVINGTGISSGGALRNISGSNTIASVGGSEFKIGSTGTRINSDAGTLHIAQTIFSTANNQNLIFGGAGETIIAGDGIGGATAQLNKDGPGVLRITGFCFHKLQTVITGGTLRLEANEVLQDESDLVVDGAGTFDLNGFSESVDGLGGSGSIIGGGTLTVGINSGITTNFSGVISGSTALIKSGTLIQILSGNNTYTGDTTISGGTLRLATTGSISNSPNITVDLGATFDVSLVSGFTLSAGQTLKGNGSVNGAVVVGSSATLAPGTSVGTLTFSSSLALTGTTSMEIDKTAATADKIVMSSGTVTLGGDLTVVNLAGTLAKGDTFDLIDGTIAGSFASITLPPLTGLAWDTTQLGVGGNGTITVVGPTADAGVDKVICNGGSTAIGGSPTASGGTGPYTYLWSPATGLDDATAANPMASPTSTTIYTVTVTDAISSVDSDSVQVTVNTVPGISAQPTNLTVCANSPAVFTVGATGGGLTYQWQLSGDAGATFTNISATATNASYTNPLTAAADNGYQYQVIVSSACGPSLTSAPPAVLTVYTPTLAIVPQGTDVVLSWTTACINYALEKTGDVGAPVTWADVTEPVVPVGDQNTVTVPVGSTNQFFRLISP
jgi:autotransporter-associated beta strand protein